MEYLKLSYLITDLNIATATLFKEFANQYGFTHTTSSPPFPQASGTAERAVRTIKDLLNKNDDLYLAILATDPLHWKMDIAQQNF